MHKDPRTGAIRMAVVMMPTYFGEKLKTTMQSPAKPVWRTKVLADGYFAGWASNSGQRRMQHNERNKPGRLVVIALTAVLNFSAIAYSQTTPFANFAGQWQGSGAINFTNNQQEPIKCRAAYDVLEEQHNLQLDIRCASQSYQFDLRGSATDKDGRISGSWSEVTRNATGTLSGTAERNRLQVLAKGSAFTATLTLIIQGDKQTVSIKSQDANASIKGATISMRRS